MLNEVPWGPHVAIKVTLRRNIHQVHIDKVVRPKPMDDCIEAALRLPGGCKTAIEAEGLKWQEAQAAAARQLDGSSAKGPRPAMAEAAAEHAQQYGVGAEAAELASDYAQWSRAAELQYLSRYGVRPEDGRAGRAKCLGRGRPVRTMRAPLGTRPKGCMAAIWGGCSDLSVAGLDLYS